MTQVTVIAHNIRSAHNVGSLLRTAEGLGISKVYLTGYTPYPAMQGDTRLPHESEKLTRQIHKTALGAEKEDIWAYSQNVNNVINQLQADGYVVAALEQTPNATPLPTYQPPAKLAIIVGREVEGIEPEVLTQTNLQLVIPMAGKKESFNVAQAAAMALYHCVFQKQF